MTQNQSLPEASVDYKSEHVKVTVQRLPGSQAKLEIIVSPQASQASYKQAVKAVNKEISLPGFRKGKAPDEVVIKKYEKPIEQEWRQILLQTSFKEALRLANLQPFNQNSIRCTEFKDIVANEPVKIVVEFEAQPIVPFIDVQELSLPHVQTPPISQHDVDQVIKNLRLYHAKWEDVTDRPVKEGDFVDLDIDNLEEGGSNICKDTRFEVTKGIMADWMRKLLVGAKLNETVEGVSEKENNPQRADDEQEEGEFKPTRCRITVKAIKHPVLPELNAEFAMKTGTKDVAELEERVKADLQRRAEEKKMLQLTRILDEKLLEKYVFDVPASLVQSEVAQRMAAQKEWMLQQHTPENEAHAIIEDMNVRLPIDVEKGCRLLFLLLGFAQQHNLNVTHDEIIAELSQQVAYGQAALGDMKDPNVVRSRITQGLLLRKAKNFIIEHVLQKKD